VIRVSVSHEPEWNYGRTWRHSWADTVDEGRLMMQMALADVGHDGGIESICFELHGGQPDPYQLSERRRQVTSAAVERYTEPSTPPLTERGLAMIEREANVLARSDAVGNYKAKPADIVLVGITAHTVGVPITTGLSDMYVIDRRVTFSARLRVGLARRAGHKVRFPETTPQAATCTLQRFGERHVETLRITIDEVPDMLKRKDNWRNYPAAMLRAMTARQLVNMAAQEVLLGIPNYATDEELEAEGIDVDDFDRDDLAEPAALDAPSEDDAPVLTPSAQQRAALRADIEGLQPHQREWLMDQAKGKVPNIDGPRFQIGHMERLSELILEAAERSSGPSSEQIQETLEQVKAAQYTPEETEAF
jgi:hypothetical protein